MSASCQNLGAAKTPQDKLTTRAELRTCPILALLGSGVGKPKYEELRARAVPFGPQPEGASGQKTSRLLKPLQSLTEGEHVKLFRGSHMPQAGQQCLSSLLGGLAAVCTHEGIRCRQRHV